MKKNNNNSSKKFNGSAKRSFSGGRGRRRRRAQFVNKRRNGSFDAVEKKEIRQENNDKSLREKLDKVNFFDPRSTENTSEKVYMDDSNPVIPFTVPTTGEALIGPVIAVVTYAVQRGWTLNVDDDDYPFQAFGYISQLLEQAAKDGVPANIMIPHWLSLIVQAIQKTSVKAASGQYEYAFNVLQSYTPADLVPMGPLAYVRNWCIGVKTPTLVNTIFSELSTGTAYDPLKGEAAAQSLFLYLSNQQPNHPRHRMVSVSDTNAMTRDASAFSVATITPGGGFGDVGGWQTIQSLEIPVYSPVFACFKAGTGQQFDNARAPCFNRTFSGDGLQLGGLLIQDIGDKQLHMKARPLVHFVDFLELGDRMARIVQRAIMLTSQSPDFLEEYANDPTGYVARLTNPLTLQEMLILLRAVVMQANAETQFKYMSLYPRTASQNSNQFISYMCGVGTCAKPGSVGMQLPLFVRENILALTGKKLNASRSGTENPTFFASVWGQYYSDVLSPSDYTTTVTVGDTTVSIPAFYENESEETISLIDGSTGSTYVAINDPAAIAALAVKWNLWMREMSNVFYATSTIGSDSGCPVLYSGCSTLHWANQGQSLQLANGKKMTLPIPSKQRRKSLTKEMKRFSAYQTQVTSPYDSKYALAISTYALPYAAAWETILQFFQFPINLIAGNVDPPAPGNYTSYTRIAAYMNEPHQLPLGTGSVNFMSLGERNDMAANLCVKTKFAEQDVIQQFLNEVQNHGEGGILSSLAASLLGAVNPKLGSIARGIATALPI
jgi:hypothetical protein